MSESASMSGEQLDIIEELSPRVIKSGSKLKKTNSLQVFTVQEE